MKRTSMLCALVLGTLLATLPAAAELNQQSATVVSVTSSLLTFGTDFHSRREQG